MIYISFFTFFSFLLFFFFFRKLFLNYIVKNVCLWTVFVILQHPVNFFILRPSFLAHFSKISISKNI